MNPVAPITPSSRSPLAMGLTFLLLGVGFANPIPLVREFPVGMWDGRISEAALNLYALTVFLGWGHFFYAWQGQWRATRRLPGARRVSYWVAVVGVLGGLVVVRGGMGVGLFSLVTWIYNIAHFIKAERVFGRGSSHGSANMATIFYIPTVAFAWLTVTLFHVGPLGEPLLVFIVTVVIAGVALAAGDWKSLTNGHAAWPLLTLFLFSETLIWSAYRPTPAFAVGVYIMHVAAASFYHYLGGYFFAQRGEQTPPLLRPPVILLVNLMCLVLGYCVARYTLLWPLRYLFGPEWFTLWVALHLLGSDLLPLWKRPDGHTATGAMASPAAISG